MSVQQLCQHLEPLSAFCRNSPDSWAITFQWRTSFMLQTQKGFSSAETRLKVCTAAVPAEPIPNKGEIHLPDRLPRATVGLCVNASGIS